MNPLVLLSSPPHASVALVAAHNHGTVAAITARAEVAIETHSAALTHVPAQATPVKSDPVAPTPASNQTNSAAQTNASQVVARIEITDTNSLTVANFTLTVTITQAASPTTPLEDNSLIRQAQPAPSTTPLTTPTTTTLAPTTPTTSTITPTAPSNIAAPSGSSSQNTTATSAQPPTTTTGNATSSSAAPVLNLSDIRLILGFQPRVGSIDVSAVLTVSGVNAESQSLALLTNPVTSSSNRQFIPQAAPVNAVPIPALATYDRVEPFLQRVIGGVGGEDLPPEPAPEPPVMPWNMAARPAVTPPAANFPAGLTILDALDATFADQFRADARQQEEQPLEGNQGAQTALAPALALAGLALALGGFWAPPANAYDREERKLPKGH